MSRRNRIKLDRLGVVVEAALKKNNKITLKKTNAALRATAVLIWERIINETPVDTGLAHNSWFIGTSVKNETGVKGELKTGYVNQSLPQKLLDKKIYLYNKQPYIETLEFGLYPWHSTKKVTFDHFTRQAPHGMVRKNLVKWDKTLFRNLQARK